MPSAVHTVTDVAAARDKPRKKYRRVLLGAAVLAALGLGGALAAIVGSGSASSPSNDNYAVAVNKLCGLDDAQHRAQPGTIRAFKHELARARTWQQREEDVLQLVDTDITNGNNLLVDLEALQPPTTAAASWQRDATRGLNASLAALNTYALSLQGVRGEGQLVARVAASDHSGPRLTAAGDTVRVALTRIGGPNCLTPIPPVSFVPLLLPGSAPGGKAGKANPHGTAPAGGVPPVSTTPTSPPGGPPATPQTFGPSPPVSVPPPAASIVTTSPVSPGAATPVPTSVTTPAR